jgi:tRNA(Ile)-lysidine synthase TilS/MesJ
MILEDGTGVEGANAYVTMDEVAEYAEEHGLEWVTSPSDDGETAIVRATTAIDARYRSRYPGYRTNGRSQSLEWPRSEAYDAEEEEIADDEIPQELKDAVCEAAVRELATPHSMMPDTAVGGIEKRIKAGSVEIERFGNAAVGPTFSIIDGILAPLLGTPSASFIGSAVRG